MPGPCNLTRKRGKATAPNKKSEKRLAARHESVPSSGYYQTGLKTSYFVKAGSQNRKK